MWELGKHHSGGKNAASTPQQQPLQNRLSTAFNRDSITINKHTTTVRNIQMSVRFVHVCADTHDALMKFAFHQRLCRSFSDNKSEHFIIDTHFEEQFTQLLCFCHPAFNGTTFNTRTFFGRYRFGLEPVSTLSNF